MVQTNSAFALPLDPRTPVVMVATGSGITRFESFVQARSKAPPSKGGGENWLFWGLRSRSSFEDPSFKDIRGASASAEMKLQVAYSRDESDSKNVGSLMTESDNKAELWRLLTHDPPVCLYLCGGPDLLLDTRRAIELVYRDLDPTVTSEAEAAQRYFSLIANNRLICDLFTHCPRTDGSAVFSEVDVAKHHTRNDCYVSYKNHVFDISEYVQMHPEGSAILMDYAGRDITKIFLQSHGANLPPIQWMEEGILASFHIGSLLSFEDFVLPHEDKAKEDVALPPNVKAEHRLLALAAKSGHAAGTDRFAVILAHGGIDGVVQPAPDQKELAVVFSPSREERPIYRAWIRLLHSALRCLNMYLNWGHDAQPASEKDTGTGSHISPARAWERHLAMMCSYVPMLHSSLRALEVMRGLGESQGETGGGGAEEDVSNALSPAVEGFKDEEWASNAVRRLTAERDFQFLETFLVWCMNGADAALPSTVVKHRTNNVEQLTGDSAGSRSRKEHQKSALLKLRTLLENIATAHVPAEAT
jgi:hypothetical protein